MALDGTERALLVAAVALFVLLAFVRFRWRGGTGQLSRALRLFDADPGEGQLELDSFFMKQAADERVARDALWAKAQTDLKVAKELRRRVLQDIETDQLARKDFGNDPEATPKLMQQIDDSERDAKAHLAKLDVLIQQLQHRGARCLTSD